MVASTMVLCARFPISLRIPEISSSSIVHYNVLAIVGSELSGVPVIAKTELENEYHRTELWDEKYKSTGKRSLYYKFFQASIL